MNKGSNMLAGGDENARDAFLILFPVLFLPASSGAFGQLVN